MSVSVGRWAGGAPRPGVGWVRTALAVATVVVALAALALGAPLVPFGLVGAVALGATLLLVPTVGTVLFFAAAWTNAPVVVTRAGGNPWLLGALAALLLLVPAFMQAVVLRRGVLFDRPFFLMLLFLGALLVSTFVASDYDLAFAWIGTYMAEGLLLYLLVLNAIRDARLLRRALWMLLAVSALMSAFAIYQEVTRDYEQTFGGFAGRKIPEQGLKADTQDSTGLMRDRERVNAQDRACGPVDDANHFAQILLVVLPIGLMLAWSARGLARLAGFGLTTLLLSGILLTYSRGGFLVLLGLIILLVILGYLRVQHVLIGAAVIVGCVIVVAPGYLKRMDSIRGVSDLDSMGDAAVTGRATEMLAAVHVLLDHPLVGVGPGQYTPFYSLNYMDDPGVAFRQIDKERRAHMLYFELGAETGVLGLTIFLGIAALVLKRLQAVRTRFAHRSEIAHIATGIGLAMVAYLGTSVFLSLAFMRYWWLVLALAGVMVRVAGQTVAEEHAIDERRVLPKAAA